MDITIPGALADHLAQHGPDDLNTAITLAEGRRGRGRTLVITPPSTTVLHIISRIAEQLLATRGTTRAQRDAARLWIKRAGHAPAVVVHRFYSTRAAYDASQCRGSIHDGDLLVIEREGVVAFLRRAWPAAITAAHGELHTIKGDPRTLDDGQYVATVDAAERVAREHEFPLAVEAEQPVEDTKAQQAATLVTEAEAAHGTWRGEWIGEHPTDALFALDLDAEQSALFNDRATAPTVTHDDEPPF